MVQSACNAGVPGSIPESGRFPWRRERLCTPLFLPEEFNGQRSLVGYSPCGHKESDMTEKLTHTHKSFNKQIQKCLSTYLFFL